MYEFWYDHIKTKILWKCKTLFMDTSSFIVYVKTDDVYKGMPKMLENDLGVQNLRQIDRYLNK